MDFADKADSTKPMQSHNYTVKCHMPNIIIYV